MRKNVVRAFQAAWLAAVVTVSLGAGTGTGTGTAATQSHKATFSCGLRCTNIFSRRLGSSFTMTLNNPSNDGTGGQIGQTLFLSPASPFSANEDFTRDEVGQVFQFCGLGANFFFSPLSYICVRYPSAPVYELEWSPFGNESGLCAGVAVTGIGGQNVVLEPCGQVPNTTWVYDSIHRTPGTLSCTTDTPPPVPAGGPGNFCPLINGGDKASFNPLVLTLDQSVSPGNQLTVRREWLVGGAASSNQQFAAYRGRAH